MVHVYRRVGLNHRHLRKKRTQNTHVSVINEVRTQLAIVSPSPTEHRNALDGMTLPWREFLRYAASSLKDASQSAIMFTCLYTKQADAQMAHSLLQLTQSVRCRAQIYRNLDQASGLALRCPLLHVYCMYSLPKINPSDLLLSFFFSACDAMLLYRRDFVRLSYKTLKFCVQVKGGRSLRAHRMPECTRNVHTQLRTQQKVPGAS